MWPAICNSTLLEFVPGKAFCESKYVVSIPVYSEVMETLYAMELCTLSSGNRRNQSNCVLTCIFVLKSICYSFIMLNFEINLLYRLKISMLSNYAGDFSFATQRDLFGSITQWWLHHCFWVYKKPHDLALCLSTSLAFIEFSFKIIHVFVIPLLPQILHIASTWPLAHSQQSAMWHRKRWHLFPSMCELQGGFQPGWKQWGEGYKPSEFLVPG